MGPELVLLDFDELARFGELRLRLSVNGEERQNALVEGTCCTDRCRRYRR